MNNKDQEIDDILNNIEFKPITEGLGFHHSLKEKKQIKTDLNQQAQALKNELETRVQQVTREALVEKTTNPINRGDLAPFYDESQTQIETKSILELGNVNTIDTQIKSDVTLGLVFSAWILDLCVLFIAMIVTFASIIYFAELPLESLSLLMAVSYTHLTLPTTPYV